MLGSIILPLGILHLVFPRIQRKCEPGLKSSRKCPKVEWRFSLSAPLYRLWLGGCPDFGSFLAAPDTS